MPTITTSNAHGLQAGDVIQVTGLAGTLNHLNGTHRVTGTSATIADLQPLTWRQRLQLRVRGLARGIARAVANAVDFATRGPGRP